MATNAGQPISIGCEPLKTELAAKSITYLNLSMPSWGTNTASPRRPIPLLARSLSWAMFAYNWTEGLFCLISPYAQKHQLTEIPPPPVAEEKGEATGRGKEPPQGWIWARNWKRRIQPRVGLKMIEPALYSTGCELAIRQG